MSKFKNSSFFVNVLLIDEKKKKKIFAVVNEINLTRNSTIDFGKS